MSVQAICGGTPNATSSPASAAGLLPCDSLGGLMIEQFGRALAPANLSARQAKAMGLMMSGTSGRLGSNSSRSAVLQQSLASRLQARMGSDGSILFALTWKLRATPSGLQICALRASARRTSGSGCGSWPTAKASDQHGGMESRSNLNDKVLPASWRSPNTVDSAGGTRNGPGQVQLCHQALLASWPTAAARDWKGATNERWGSNARPLNEVAALAHWPTPMAGTPAQNGNNAAGNTDSSRRTVDLCGWGTPTSTEPGGTPEQYVARSFDQTGNSAPTMLAHQALLASGPTPTGSPAETAKRGRLNPDHSRWLMGYPAAWGSCGATAMQLCRKLPRNGSGRTST